MDREQMQELINGMRKIVKPYLAKQLKKLNFEGCGNTDKAEFETDFEIVLTLAEQALAIPSSQKWIPVSERLPEEGGDYFVTYEKGYAEDYNLPPIGIAGFEVDCESFGYWHEHFDRQTLGSLGSEWEEIKVIAWMPLPEPWKGE